MKYEIQNTKYEKGVMRSDFLFSISHLVFRISDF